VVRRDHGAEVAAHVSRRLVFAMFRDGGQRQFVERPVPAASQEGLGSTLAWAQERLDEPLSVTDLARRAHVSVTTLHRRFRAELGTTPLTPLPATAGRTPLGMRS
jgi:AraC family transcriptional activator FtrA